MNDQNRLHQINATYLPEEDRILLRLTTTGGAEFRCWLTRRYLLRLWPMMIQTIERLSSAGLPPACSDDPALRARMARQAHAPLTSKLDMKTEFSGGQQFPAGTAPLLMTRITQQTRGPGQQLLRLEPARGEGLDIVLDELLAHTLLRLLSEAVARADWGIDTGMPVAPAGEPAPRPEQLH
jgi:hypothetical protein